MGGLTGKEQADLFEKITRKWWKFIVARQAKAKLLTGNTLTEDIRELLARGFVHYEDIGWEEEEPVWTIQHLATKLTYPKEFLSQASAQEFFDKFGIPGCTIIKQ